MAAPAGPLPGRLCGNADALAAQYESLTFAQVHRDVLHLIPQEPVVALDIGAGTGRDAAALAKRRATGSWRSSRPRRCASRGMRLHGSPRIEWVDDSLPDLLQLRARGDRFDLLMATGGMDAYGLRAAAAVHAPCGGAAAARRAVLREPAPRPGSGRPPHVRRLRRRDGDAWAGSTGCRSYTATSARTCSTGPMCAGRTVVLRRGLAR